MASGDHPALGEATLSRGQGAQGRGLRAGRPPGPVSHRGKALSPSPGHMLPGGWGSKSGFMATGREGITTTSPLLLAEGRADEVLRGPRQGGGSTVCQANGPSAGSAHQRPGMQRSHLPESMWWAPGWVTCREGGLWGPVEWELCGAPGWQSSLAGVRLRPGAAACGAANQHPPGHLGHSRLLRFREGLPA